MKAEAKPAPFERESTADFFVAEQGAKPPKLMVGKKATVTVTGIVTRVTADKDGYGCSLTIKSLSTGADGPSSLSEDIKAAKRGNKAEESAEGE